MAMEEANFGLIGVVAGGAVGAVFHKKNEGP
jgi:hypothetical protein